MHQITSGFLYIRRKKELSFRVDAYMNHNSIYIFHNHERRPGKMVTNLDELTTVI